MGNNNTGEVSWKGVIEFLISVKGKHVPCKLLNVLHVPQLGYQVLSVTTLDKSGLKPTLHSAKCYIEKYSCLVSSGSMKGKLYELDVPSPSIESSLICNDLTIRHRRLAPLQTSTIIYMVNSQAVIGISLRKAVKTKLKCTGCMLGKGHRAPIPRTTSSKTTRFLELVQSDVDGPIEVLSLGGPRYFATFINDYYVDQERRWSGLFGNTIDFMDRLERWKTLYTMKQKSEALECFKKYRRFAEKHTWAKLASINTTNRT